MKNINVEKLNACYSNINQIILETWYFEIFFTARQPHNPVMILFMAPIDLTNDTIFEMIDNLLEEELTKFIMNLIIILQLLLTMNSTFTPGIYHKFY